MASFLTLNINGLRDANKRMAFLQWLSHLSLDFTCLQKTHVTSVAECISWFSSYGFLSTVSPCSAHSCGSVILYWPRYTLLNSWVDSSGQFVLAEFQDCDVIFRVACIFAPNRNPDRDTFFSFVSLKIDPSVATVVCGDFNTVFDRSIDRRGSNASDPSRESSASLLSLFRDCGIVDIWRSLHPATIAFSWLRPDGALSSRIDFINCPYPWIHLVQFCDMLACPFSDHCAVMLSVPIPVPTPCSPDCWKLNVSILKDVDFRSSVSDFWAEWKSKKQSFDSLQSWWDTSKSHLKGLAIQFCLSKSKEQNQARALLQSMAQPLKVQINIGRVSLLSVYEATLSKLASLDLAAAEGAHIRSRTCWEEEGEASTSYFFRLQKKNGTDDWISAMKEPDGSLVGDVHSICDSWVSFYSTLFSARPTNIDVQNRLLDNLTSALPPSQVHLCEGHLTTDEVHEALLGMTKRKSPGTDGLPAEFYLTFWDVLGPDLVELLNASFDSGLLPLSQRDALISLVFKKGDRLLHKNWRPISLLNVDNKICARALAERLLKVIHLVIFPNQTCGVPHHFISENVALLRDVVHYANEADLPLAILSLD